MSKDILIGRQVSRAICEALDIDINKHSVIDVTIDIGHSQVATVSVKYILKSGIVKKISDIIQGKTDAETKP